MDPTCILCEEKFNADQLNNLADHAKVFYNITAIDISVWEDTNLMKICDLCEEKLLQYEIFRSLCIKVCTKLSQHSRVVDVSSSASIKLEDIEGALCADDKLINDTHTAIEDNRQPSPGKNLETTIEHNSTDEAFETELQKDSEMHANDSSDSSEKKNTLKVPRCHLCGKKFRMKSHLEGHIRVHQGLKPALCKLCGKSFIRWHSLKLHMLQKHTERRTDAPKTTFKCDFAGCELAFANKQGMLHHRKKHNPEYTKPTPMTFVCELCGKTFSSKGSLQKHSYIHTGNMPFNCALCDKRYPTSHKLKEHTMRHQGIKNHTCPQCGLKKTTMHELRVHMNYHTKERTFPCGFCTKIFMNTGNLATHVKTVHQKLTPFSCTHCSRSFGKKESLKRHIMTHTGERPHECSVCGKRFIQLVALRSHSKVHTKKGDC